MQWLTTWLARWRQRRATQRAPLGERDQAQQLVDAIDRGGLPLNPARVNQIARGLGLEVSRHASVEHTVARIRQALARGG